MSRERTFEVYLIRKSTENDVQNSRKRVEHVRAETKDQAVMIALAMPQNAAFRVQSIREQ